MQREEISELKFMVWSASKVESQPIGATLYGAKQFTLCTRLRGMSIFLCYTLQRRAVVRTERSTFTPIVKERQAHAGPRTAARDLKEIHSLLSSNE